MSTSENRNWDINLFQLYDASNTRECEIRPTMDGISLFELYASSHRKYITLLVHHDGSFENNLHSFLTSVPGRYYSQGKKVFVDFVEVNTFSRKTVEDIAIRLGHKLNGLHAYVLRQDETLDVGLMKLESVDDFEAFKNYQRKEASFCQVVEFYFEHGSTTVFDSWPKSLKYGTPKRLGMLLLDLYMKQDKVYAAQARDYVWDKYKVKLSWGKIEEGMKYAREHHDRWSGEDGYLWV